MGKIKCPHCNKEYSKYGIGNHIWRTHGEGQNFKSAGNHNPPWNKGLTKKTDERVKLQSEKPRRKHTDESKLQMSENKKKYFKEHPEKHPIYLCRGRKSYPQNKLYEYLKTLYLNIEQEYYYEGYWIDILISDQLAIEVDGEYWHNGREEYDAKREKIISKKYQVIRFSASEVLNNFEQVILVINKLISDKIYDIYECKCDIDYKLLKRLLKIINRKNIKIINKNKNDIKNKPKIDLILNSNIDFSKYGWVEKASKILEIVPQNIHRWMKKNMLEFYNTKCFVRGLKDNMTLSKKLKQEIKNNKLIKDKELEKKINLIINSNIDFSKYGWIKKAAKILNISRLTVNCWMKRNMLDFYNKNCLKNVKNCRKKNKKDFEKEKVNIIKINLILNSNINFSKYGWVNEAAKILNITPSKVNCWMKRNMLEFYNTKCFVRGLKDITILSQKSREEIENKKLIKKQKIEDRKQLILNSNIDFSKRGWVNNVANLLGMGRSNASRWVKEYMIDFYNEKCYKYNS